MAALAIPIATLVVPLIAQLIPQIVQLFQKAHPIPPDATTAVKADVNALKASGALATAMAIVQQLATAGKIPVSGTDPGLISAVAGAIEQEYQGMKADGTLNAPAVMPVPPVSALAPQIVRLAHGQMLVVTD